MFNIADSVLQYCAHVVPATLQAIVIACNSVFIYGWLR